jgi:hypothetical protein
MLTYAENFLIKKEYRLLLVVTKLENPNEGTLIDNDD